MDKSASSLVNVKHALDWAYRNGYTFAEIAASELAHYLGEKVVHVDLGQYGDKLEFRPDPAPLPSGRMEPSGQNAGPVYEKDGNGNYYAVYPNGLGFRV